MNKITIPHDIKFEGFGKIQRPNKAMNCFITEKLDGTNAQIVIENNTIVAVGSRNRWLEPGKETDNFGFAGWVQDNYEDILSLGDGTHFGEWYGSGIQRTYGLKEKRFALFNAGRWTNEDTPSCVEVVPVLYQGEYAPITLAAVMGDLSMNGSRAVPGFMKPEGVIVYFTGLRVMVKDTFEANEGKWKEAL